MGNTYSKAMLYEEPQDPDEVFRYAYAQFTHIPIPELTLLDRNFIEHQKREDALDAMRLFNRGDGASAKKVFAIPELLEMVLLEVDHTSVLRWLAVDHRLRNTILQSKVLRRYLWLEHERGEYTRACPSTDWYFDNNEQIEGGIEAQHICSYKHDTLNDSDLNPFVLATDPTPHGFVIRGGSLVGMPRLSSSELKPLKPRIMVGGRYFWNVEEVTIVECLSPGNFLHISSSAIKKPVSKEQATLFDVLLKPCEILDKATTLHNTVVARRKIMTPVLVSVHVHTTSRSSVHRSRSIYPEEGPFFQIWHDPKYEENRMPEGFHDIPAGSFFHGNMFEYGFPINGTYGQLISWLVRKIERELPWDGSYDRQEH